MMGKRWYAVMTGRDDTDWSWGSYDREESERIVVNNLDRYPNGYIAVIDEGDSSPWSKVCLRKIRPEDFSDVFRLAAVVLKAHDYDACRDELAELAKLADIEDEWKAADGDNFKKVIRKMQFILDVDLGLWGENEFVTGTARIYIE